MTEVALLCRIGEALYGERWRAPLARDLDVTVRTMQRWAAGEWPLPAGVWPQLAALLAARRRGIAALVDRLGRAPFRSAIAAPRPHRSESEEAALSCRPANSGADQAVPGLIEKRDPPMPEPAPRWRPIGLSGKHKKAMDRVGGAELILPWPPGLPPGAPIAELALGLDPGVRDAIAAEHHAAEAIVGPACRAAGLVPIRSTVARLRRPPGADVWQAEVVMQHLVVLIIGRRWVHASTRRSPGQCWHTDPIEPA